MSIANNKAVVRRFYEEVMGQRKLHLIDELVAENFVDHNPEPGQPPNRDGIKPMFRNWFEVFPDMTARVDHMVCEGNLVGTHLVMSGTHLGEFMGQPATGRYIETSGFDWARVENGTIVERWGVFDMAGMMQQLGMVPGPSSDDLKKLSKRYYELLDAARGDLASLRSELFHPQHVTHFAGQPTLDAEGLQHLMQMFWTSFPDIDHSLEAQICEGDRVLNHLTVKATHKGDFAGVPATNKACEIEAMTSQRWVDGKLVEQTINVDMVSLLQQIGAIPAQ